MVGGISSGSLFLCTLRGSFRLNHIADTLILMCWKLIAQLVHYILEMLLQGFILEMSFNGLLPSMVQP